MKWFLFAVIVASAPVEGVHDRVSVVALTPPLAFASKAECEQAAPIWVELESGIEYEPDDGDEVTAVCVLPHGVSA